ncbi:hypothetical protein LTR84_003687 [Exophiala bonariae]|uniref:HTH araC/xylS-type domain-containing protein n=1 Tax=Exophiala bonariae TaxID=1690606 RepID=A0AAV9N9K1_9EURO|nr:hypothetical protein LTR84_003687 [Exophiala bonariae]
MAQTLLPASIESLATASYSLFDEVEGHPVQPIVTPTTTSNLQLHLLGRVSPKSHYAHNRFVNTYSTPSARWAALTIRDPAATDAFIYAVRTTKIYCRPDCRARLARRANVAFYDNVHQARLDGYRACKRCKPDPVSRTATEFPKSSNPTASEVPIASEQLQNQSSSHEQFTDTEDARTKIKHAVQIIQQSAQQGSKLSLSQLSKEVGWSKWHLHRVFKQLQGMTPREMADGLQPMSSRGDSVSENFRTDPVPREDDLPVLCNGSEWIDFESTDGLFSLPPPPLTSLLSTPSTDDALTPIAWGDELSYDPVLFHIDAAKDQETELDGLLNDLFPELFGAHGLAGGG